MNIPFVSFRWDTFPFVFVLIFALHSPHSLLNPSVLKMRQKMRKSSAYRPLSHRRDMWLWVRCMRGDQWMSHGRGNDGYVSQWLRAAMGVWLL